MKKFLILTIGLLAGINCLAMYTPASSSTNTTTTTTTTKKVLEHSDEDMAKNNVLEMDPSPANSSTAINSDVIDSGELKTYTKHLNKLLKLLDPKTNEVYLKHEVETDIGCYNTEIENDFFREALFRYQGHGLDPETAAQLCSISLSYILNPRYLPDAVDNRYSHISALLFSLPTETQQEIMKKLSPEVLKQISKFEHSSKNS